MNNQYNPHFARTKFLTVVRRILNTGRLFFRNRAGERFLIERNIKSNGKSMLAKLFAPPGYIYQSPSWREYERNGRRFKLDISNFVDNFIYFEYRDEGFENLKKRIKEDFCIADIGANIGLTAVDFARSTPKGRVICFEPSTTNYKRLVNHIDLNELKNVTAVNKGIGDAPGEYKLYTVCETNLGMNRILSNVEVGDEFNFEKIVIGRLEDELKAERVEKVDLIKIDVEGFEFEVLKGAKSVLDKDRPILFVELDDDNLKENNSSAAEVVSFLKAMNYKISSAAALTPLPDDFDFSNCHFDILCERL